MCNKMLCLEIQYPYYDAIHAMVTNVNKSIKKKKKLPQQQGILIKIGVKISEGYASHDCSVWVSYLPAGLLNFINSFPAEYIVVVSVRARIPQRMRQFVVKKHPFEQLSLSVGCVLSCVLSLTLQLVRCRVTERERHRGKSLGQCYSSLFTWEGPGRPQIAAPQQCQLKSTDQ